MDFLIEVRQLTKEYIMGDSKIKALDNISFNIKKGEFVSIIGSSGSGKSTLMNILGGLDIQTSGDYRLDGINIKNAPDSQLSFIRNQKIGFIFQNFNLISDLNAIENVELQLIYRGMNKTDRKKLSINSLEQVGLGERLYHKPKQMSGGQQQRVAIARAIASSPPLILADEPTGNLDSKSTNEIIQILRKINKNGNTVILITHDDNVANVANRIIKIIDGKLIFDKRIKKRVE